MFFPRHRNTNIRKFCYNEMNFSFQFAVLFLVHSSLCELAPKNSLTHILDHGEKQYYFANSRGTFFDAYTFCRLEGMQLITIDSASEQSAIEEAIKPAGTSNVWTSGNRLNSLDEFLWLSTGRVLMYENWATGEPSNDNSNELCIEIVPNGEWNDKDCNADNYFICEKISNPC